jgi:hypothetical protein
VSSSFPDRSSNADAGLGRLFDVTLGLASSDGDLEAGSNDMVPFTVGGPSLCHETLSLPLSGRGEGTCIMPADGAGVPDRKSSHEASVGSPDKPVVTNAQ